MGLLKRENPVYCSLAYCCWSTNVLEKVANFGTRTFHCPITENPHCIERWFSQEPLRTAARELVPMTIRTYYITFLGTSWLCGYDLTWVRVGDTYKLSWVRVSYGYKLTWARVDDEFIGNI